MTTSNPDLDAKLKKFLDDSARERAEGYTLANIALRVNQALSGLKEVRDSQRALETRVARHGRELRAVKRIVEYEGEPDTGQHDVEELRREMERSRAEKEAERHQQEAETVWWKRQIVTWIVAGVAFAVAQAITVLITLAMSGGHHP